MSILWANLKHLYQKRSFWLLGLVFGAIAFGVAMVIAEAVTENKEGGFSGPVLWILVVGTIIATLPIDVLTKPFSYCLPGHREVPRKFVFFVGLPLSLLWSLSFLFFPDLNFGNTVLVCLSAFSTFTIFYWLGVWLVFKFRNWSVFFAFFPLLILGNMWLNVSTIIVHAIVESPLPMILSGGLVNFLAWRYWGRSDLARRYCGAVWMGAFDAWNKEKMLKYKLARLAERDKKKPSSMRISSGVERFFISRISGATTGSLRQYIWGGFYKTFGIMVSQYREDWMRFLMLMLPILCFLGYTGPAGHIIFFMPGMMVAFMSLNVHSSLLISGSRRERFWSALTLAAATAVLITVFVTLLAALTMPLELILPELTIKGKSFVFHSLSMKLFFVPLLMVPVTLTIGLIFHKEPMLTMILAMVFFQILFMWNLVRNLRIMNVPVQIGPVHVIIMLLCSWGVFVAVLRYISMRCCLVSQGR